MSLSPYGPCGLYCGACGAPDCDGCHSERVGDWVERCRFRACAREKNVEFCCFCGDCPCEELRAFTNDRWPHHRTAKRNLEFIREHGVEKWLETRKREWSCPDCGAEIRWYQKNCPCGQQLKAWDPPA